MTEVFFKNLFAENNFFGKCGINMSIYLKLNTKHYDSNSVTSQGDYFSLLSFIYSLDLSCHSMYHRDNACPRPLSSYV